MTIRHHPDMASLMFCAAGSQPEVFAAVIASHLSVCSECRGEVGRMQRLGVALFDHLPEADLIGEAPVIAARAGEADIQPEVLVAPATTVGAADVPAPLTHILGARLDDLDWRWVGLGVQRVSVPLSKGAAGSLMLLKVSPGRALPEHGHDGQELTLVLRGSYSDATGTYSAGDVAEMDHGAEHAPVADPHEGCICLCATDGDLQFKGLFTRLLGPALLRPRR